MTSKISSTNEVRRQAINCSQPFHQKASDSETENGFLQRTERQKAPSLPKSSDQ